MPIGVDRVHSHQLRIDFLAKVARELIVAELGEVNANGSLATWPSPFGSILVTLPERPSQGAVPTFMSVQAPAELIEAAVLAKSRGALKSSLGGIVQALGCPPLPAARMSNLLNETWSMFEAADHHDRPLQNALETPPLDAHDDIDAVIMNFSGLFNEHADKYAPLGRA